MREERAVLQAVAGAREEIARAALDLGAVLQLVCDTALGLLAADTVVVDLVEGEELVVCALSGSYREGLGARLGLGSSLAGGCLRTGRVIRCGDTLHDPRSDFRHVSRSGFRSILCVPIVDYGLPVGVLQAASRREHAFADREAGDLGLLAEVVANHLG
jgi:GAF domain-containing protein